ncbi:hypothetical protein [Rubellimicrobium roseum]|uniref:Uncharacterized protein n=1 Tax=Rubellimicrobium roseum TaxID=687525 RepID=A0A5C4NCV5_9RHOB|nr:hypothetical protein [Rubellimicrobium roseum]TNC70849.1 hypothetical protein FHG71_12655 [Rubellimicrobium roseum]
MQVMILEEDPTLRTEVAAALAPEGFDILSFGRLGPAKEAARSTALDLLVLGESVEGRLAHDVALLAEWRSPGLGAILLSDRRGDEVEELFELIPSLQAVLGRRTGARTLAQVALSAAQAQSVRPRLAAPPEEAQPVATLAGPGAGDDQASKGDLGPQDFVPETALVPAVAPLPERTTAPVEAVRPVDSPSPVLARSAMPESSSLSNSTMPIPVLGPVSALPAPIEPAAEPALRVAVPDKLAAPAPATSEPSLSPAETRRLLAELGRRYARLVEGGAPVLSRRPTLGQPLSPPTLSAAVLPLRRPARPLAEPDPTPAICPQMVAPPAAPHSQSRRLTLA